MFAGFFFMIFLTLLIIIIIGGSIIRGILGFLFGRRSFRQPYEQSGQSQQYHNHTEQTHRTDSQSQSRRSASPNEKKREKIFDKTDGEYVDFEEL